MDDYQRHSDLVDKKFLTGLTPPEVIELEQINRRLDDIEAAWFEPIKEKLYAIFIANIPATKNRS